MIEEIQQHFEASYPREACGIIGIVQGKKKWFPCTNVAENEDDFILSSDEYFEIVKNATEKDLQRFLTSLKDKRDLVNNSDERDSKLNKYKEAHRVQSTRLHLITSEYGNLSNEMANAIDMTPYIKVFRGNGAKSVHFNHFNGRPL